MHHISNLKHGKFVVQGLLKEPVVVKLQKKGTALHIAVFTKVAGWTLSPVRSCFHNLFLDVRFHLTLPSALSP
jgi:hypothetical protein